MEAGLAFLPGGKSLPMISWASGVVRKRRQGSRKPLNNRRPEIYSGYAGLGRDSGPENLSLSGFL